MKKFLLKSALVVFMAAALFSSCKSLKDILIDGPRDQMEANLAQIEALVVPLEASSILQPSAGEEGRRRQSELTSARHQDGR